MVSIEESRKIFLLQNLAEGTLQKMIPHLQVMHFKEGEIVFKEGSKAENFYMLKKGKVLLEVEVSKQLTISLGSIKSGYSFGWSALLAGPSHTSHAVCAEASVVFAMPGEKFRAVLESDPITGYRVMAIAASVLKNRLERRRGQLLKVIANHPDMLRLLDSSTEDGVSPG